MSYSQVSIDIETISTKQNAVVASIGACLFSTKRAKVATETFYIQLDTAKQYHRHVCLETIKWWNKQDKSVKDQTFGGTLRAHEVLLELSAYIPKGVRAVWARGCLFDLGILQNMYEEQGVPVPWPYWAPQELRTLELIASKAGIKKYPKPKEGIAHNALNDAIHQAESIIHYHRALGLVKC